MIIIDMPIDISKSNTELMAELGAKFRKLRISCNLTEQELSGRSGVSVFTINSFENGRGNITLKTLLSLLRYTGQMGNLDNLIDDVLPDPFDRGGKERKRVRNEK